jgi:hypothetical protein
MRCGVRVEIRAMRRVRVRKAAIEPERMNSPLEIREVRLRGLPLPGPARVHRSSL